ncbi:hypothetical protein RIF29_09435 [Crotalaria pallida]|uniref:Uncharacterized protein n=1 Tax=Crotalaria pallida TaxID=3830 RepID=A0AAN9FRX4_CROPI
MILKLMLLLCLVSVISNHASLSTARQLKNPSNEEEKKQVIGSESVGGGEHQSKNNTSNSADQPKNPPNEEKKEVNASESGGGEHQSKNNTLSSADQPKNNPPNEEKKEVIAASESVGGRDPSKKNNKAKMGGVKDEKHPFPLPQFPWPMQPPVGGLPFPSPFDVPIIPPLPFEFPPWPFPDLDIPGIVPSPPA